MIIFFFPAAGFFISSNSIHAESPDACRLPRLDSIGEIRLEGLKTTRTRVVMRELSHKQGGRFACAEWMKEKTRLEDLDIFSEVRLRMDSAGGHFALVYEFRELPPYIPFVAMSKTEQDGLSLGPALASLNLLGWDIRSEFIARFGGTTEFQASMSSPWLGPWPVEYDLAALRVDSYNRFENFHEDSWRLKLDLAHRVWESASGGKAQILYAGELFMLDAGGAPGITLSPGKDLVPRLGMGFLWDGRDRRHNPTRGWYQEMRVTQNGGFLGGDGDYAEWLSDSRTYFPWLTRNVRHLAALYQYRAGDIGNSFGVYDLFHAGGINTLRGYGNDAFRGKSECIVTLENRIDLFRKRTFRIWGWGGYFGLQGILGLESASLWDHHALMERDFNNSVYAGAHLLIAGVDRVRLEIGSNTAKLKILFDLGILEKADIQRFRAR